MKKSIGIDDAERTYFKEKIRGGAREKCKMIRLNVEWWMVNEEIMAVDVKDGEVCGYLLENEVGGVLV